uniref:RING-type domain-containing protein n=1 Tax=Nelumbo nucifera TaxID=4432 RepID=A0A822YI98_NELNU|nr:TPA_asm: hypothetical protein HUJ06_011053 [Nelumbo nucifera]
MPPRTTEFPFRLQKFCVLFKSWQENTDDRSSDSFRELHSKFFVDSKIRCLVRLVNGETKLVCQKQIPAIKATFSHDPDTFCENTSEEIFSELLSEVRVNVNDVSDGRRLIYALSSVQEMICHCILSSVQKIISWDSNSRRNKLSMYAGIGVLFLCLYDERAAIERALRESIEEDDGRGYGFVPASEASIKALETVKFDVEGDSTEECRICLDEFEVGSLLKRMPCSHLFHERCITGWLEKSHYCPLCRFNMLT